MRFTDQVEHEWTQVGACVYCSCGVRLYQGKVVKDKLAAAQAMDGIMEKAEREAEERDAREWAARTPEQEKVYGEGFVAMKPRTDALTRLSMNPYTPRRTGKTWDDPEVRWRMKWWYFGWDDAEAGRDRRSTSDR